MLFFKRVKSLVVADLLKKDLLKNVVAAFEEKRIQCGCFRMAIFVWYLGNKHNIGVLKQEC